MPGSVEQRSELEYSLLDGRARRGHAVGIEHATRTLTADANRKLAAFTAFAVVVAAIAISVVPFRDHGQRCGPPITAAGRGKTVVTWPFPAPFLPYGVPAPPPVRTTYCREPARVRLGIAGSAIAALFVFTLRWSVLDPRRRMVRLRASDYDSSVMP